jgi:arylsulfatase A-like enzyme
MSAACQHRASSDRIGPVHLARVLLALCLCALSAGCLQDGSGQGRGLLVIAVDALRADHLSGAGYDRPTTPVLDRLAQEGIAFERAFATAPQLLPAHASLLSGSDPNLARRGVRPWMAASVDQAWRLPADAPRLSVELAVAGYRTAAFVDHPDLSPVVGLRRGFQHYAEVWDASSAEDPPGLTRATRLLRQWLGGLSSEDDWFAYVHVNDLERLWRDPGRLSETYFPPRRELAEIPPVGSTDPSLFAIPPSRWIGGSFSLGHHESRYDGALREVDAGLGRLFEALARAGRLERTTVCVVGSFGLQFGEAGLLLDHGRLSPADLHVPWIVRPSRELDARLGRRVDVLASTMDLAPTLLELAGVERPQAMLGVSQAAALRGEDSPAREFTVASCAIQGGYAAFDGDWALEVCLPGEAPEHLVVAWFGERPAERAGVTRLAYRYREQPYPLRAAEANLGPAALSLANRARNYIEVSETLRAQLQAQSEYLVELPEGPGR